MRIGIDNTSSQPEISAVEQASSSTDSPLRTRRETTPGVVRCEKCLEQLTPGMDDGCWRCNDLFTHLSLDRQPSPMPATTRARPLPASWPTSSQPQVFGQVPSQTPYQFNSPFVWPPGGSTTQPLPSTSSYSPFTYGPMPQASGHQLQPSQASFVGLGTSSNPIDLENPSRTTGPSTYRPSYQSFRALASSIGSALLNKGWPVPGQTPQSNQTFDPASYLNITPSAYDYTVPAPSTEEIKELLSNIRPDEEIKVEDEDAIIPGLAKHMRLMKHQQMGLAWMQKMEDGKNKGGILADEMGLGKTIQRYLSSLRQLM